MLVGTERSLPLSCDYLVLRLVEQLEALAPYYCRLTYGRDRLSLESIVAKDSDDRTSESLAQIRLLVNAWGGLLLTQTGKQNRGLEILLELPYGQQPMAKTPSEPILSNREQEIMGLLAQGHRDREIAQQLHISESTVKFHVNNTLTKLKAKNRYQAVYEVTSRAWI